MKWRSIHGTRGTLAPPQSVPHIRDMTGTGSGSELPVLAGSLVPAKICFADVLYVALRYQKRSAAFLGKFAVAAKADPSPWVSSFLRTKLGH